MPLVDKVVALHQVLDASGIDHAFGGALALGYHARPRGTREIDLNIFLPPAERAGVLDVVGPLGIEPPAGTTPEESPTAGVRCPWESTHVDLFFSYDEEWFDSVRSRVEDHIFVDSADREHVLPFLSAEDLIVFKVTFNRPKDWVDIGSILEERPVDSAYVQRWLLYLRGNTEWPRIRRFLDLCDQIKPGAVAPESPDDRYDR